MTKQKFTFAYPAELRECRARLFGKYRGDYVSGCKTSLGWCSVGDTALRAVVFFHL